MVKGAQSRTVNAWGTGCSSQGDFSLLSASRGAGCLELLRPSELEQVIVHAMYRNGFVTALLKFCG